MKRALREDDGRRVDGQTARSRLPIMGQGQAAERSAFAHEVEGAGPVFVGQARRAAGGQGVEAQRGGGVLDRGAGDARLETDPARTAGCDEATLCCAEVQSEERGGGVEPPQRAVCAPATVGDTDQRAGDRADVACDVGDIALIELEPVDGQRNAAGGDIGQAAAGGTQLAAGLEGYPSGETEIQRGASIQRGGEA